jgi:AAA ATPase domain
MSTQDPDFDPKAFIEDRFAREGIHLERLEERTYPEETIFVLKVAPPLEPALQLSNELDRELTGRGFKGFVTVRLMEPSAQTPESSTGRGVTDERVSSLLTLITARSQASESQPSLSYVPNQTEIITTVVSPRHHLIFGRRGAGKTALMAEAKRYADQQGDCSAWINLQTYRNEGVDRTFAWICRSICERIEATFTNRAAIPQFVALSAQLRSELEQITISPQPKSGPVSLLPRMQSLLKRFLESTGKRIYLFLDELHYVPRNDQARLLDLVHGAVRDCNAFLKIAGIKHLCKWYQPNPPTGLQTGQDAESIDLDVTLENPTGAKVFLEKVLQKYASHCGLRSLSSVFSSAALDRLVLASGAVPRDYLVLSGRAIRQARQRSGSRTVGMQDVNKAAGEALTEKLSELQEDAASTGEDSLVIQSLQVVSEFCTEEKGYTYFRIDFRDKNMKPKLYGFIQDLMDLRLLHLVESSLSDERHAGRRSEVYMLDLSQYSGQRLRRKLKVLNFEDGYLVLKDTGTKKESRVGRTPNQRLGILRRGPLFDLDRLAAPQPEGAVASLNEPA